MRGGPSPLPICKMCRFYKPGAGEEDGVSKCQAFPDGIPSEIIEQGFDHREQLGDETIVFELDEAFTDEDLAEWEQSWLQEEKGEMDWQEHKADMALGPEEEEFLPE